MGGGNTATSYNYIGASVADKATIGYLVIVAGFDPYPCRVFAFAVNFQRPGTTGNSVGEPPATHNIVSVKDIRPDQSPRLSNPQPQSYIPDIGAGESRNIFSEKALVFSYLFPSVKLTLRQFKRI